MSEEKKEQMVTKNLRRHWLATASTLVLAACVLTGNEVLAAARDEDHPVVWIELGSQLERVGGRQDPFMPPFATDMIAAGFESPAVAQTPPHYAFGGEAKISFTPNDTDWTIAVGLRYGRSLGKKHKHDQRSYETRFPVVPGFYITVTQQLASDSKTHENESHTVLDFQAGKDVGLGAFGRAGTSSISAGVRFAEFTSKATDTLFARPDYSFVPRVLFGLHLYTATRSDFHGIAQNERSFRGIGPSLAWNSSSLIGGDDDGGLSFDWGVNAAVLFGRQKAAGHHQTTAYHYQQKYGPQRRPLYELAYPRHAADHARAKSVFVPNIGGFAGFSLRWPNAKVSLGYRGDFFFGAVDGGIDTRKSSTPGFHGPFASISVGVGD